MLRQLGSLASHSDRVERLLVSAAFPRGFASTASSSGWFRGGQSSSSGDDGSNGATTSGIGDDTSAVASSSSFIPTDVPLLDDTSYVTGFDPVGIAANVLEQAHATSGLPWWCTIACGAVAVRAALFPFTVKQAKAGSLLNTAIARARDKDGNPPRDIKSVLAAAKELRRVTNGVSLGWLVAGPMVQLPTFVLAVMSVRRMVANEINTHALQSGGTLWFHDLTQSAVDLQSATAPMGIYGAVLPIAVAGALFANINNSFGTAAEKSKPALIMKLTMEWLCVPTLLIGLTLPQAVHMYWLPASLNALLQGVIMRTEVARTTLGIDPVFDPTRMKEITSNKRGTSEESGNNSVKVDGAGAGVRVEQTGVLFERDLTEHELQALRSAAEATSEERFADAARILENCAASIIIGDGDVVVDDNNTTNATDTTASSSLSLATAHPAVLFALAHTFGKLKQWRQAARVYQQCASGETNAERRGRALTGAGVAYANVGDADSLHASIHNLEASLAIRENDLGTMLSLAAVLKKTGDFAGAVEILERASKISPDVTERFLKPLLVELEKREVKKATPSSKRGKGKRR